MMRHIILLHGALGSQLQFDKLKKLLESDFNVHTLDFSGHGKKSLINEFSIDGFAKDVKDYANNNNLQNAHLFGFSMGGYIALKCAKEYPNLVDKIVTLGTKFNWSPAIASKEIKMLNPDVIKEKVPKFADHLKNLHQGLGWEELLRLTGRFMIELGNGKGLSDTDLIAILNDVLICLGSDDQMVSREESENASQLLNNARFQALEGFSHPIEKNDVNVIGELIKEHFSN